MCVCVCVCLRVRTYSGYFVQWHIKPFGLFNAEVILLEQQGYYLTESWGYKEVHTFPEDLSPKVNVIYIYIYLYIYIYTKVYSFLI